MKIVSKRRKRERKTNYNKRKRLLEVKKPRLVIRKTNRYIILQYIVSTQAEDKVKYSITSKELLKYGWSVKKQGSLKAISACYLSGLLFGKKIEKEETAILDIGLHRSTKGSRIYATLNGIIDSGIKMPHDKKMFPTEAKIKNMENFETIKKNVMKK